MPSADLTPPLRDEASPTSGALDVKLSEAWGGKGQLGRGGWAWWTGDDWRHRQAGKGFPAPEAEVGEQLISHLCSQWFYVEGAEMRVHGSTV